MYKRQVQNWNAGKSQEFKERKVYDLGRSHLRHQGPLEQAKPAEPVPAAAPKAADHRVLLFTTKTCPNCKAADLMLKKAGLAYEKVDAEEQQDLTLAYGVKQAPSLVVVDGDRVEKHVNASNIKKYLEQSIH